MTFGSRMACGSTTNCLADGSSYTGAQIIVELAATVEAVLRLRELGKPRSPKRNSVVEIGQGLSAGSPCGGLIPTRTSPCIGSGTIAKKLKPPKTKAELREMLAEAVRNTQPEPERPLKPKRGSGRLRRR